VVGKGTFWAHSPGETGQPQDLWEHLQNVAELAATAASKFGARELGYWAGLWHDVGKIHVDWQAYVRRGVHSGGPDHKGAGAVLALQYAPGLAPVIVGHHGGLWDIGDLQLWLKSRQKEPYIQEALQQVRNCWPDAAPTAKVPVPSYANRDHLTGEFFTRLLFSALVDADRLDTEAHASPSRAALRQAPTPTPAQLLNHLTSYMAGISGHRTDPVGQARHQVYTAALSAARQPPGFFRLTVPTGGGKTLSSLAFALAHAAEHGLDRVIVAIPYTSIIEQTADAYRKVFRDFGDEVVLEHHSSLQPPEDPNNLTSAELWASLAAENWDAPVVVTTTVQLFESLFSNLPSRCRKLHNVVRSVIILDEVQTLPTELLEPILDGLRQLVSHYGCSVVLCTATQPALDDSPYLMGLPNVREIVPDPPRLFAALRRVEYELPAAYEAWTWERVAEEMRKFPQVLAVVNTRADAQALLAALDDPDALHLSTLLCGAHRRDVLAEVRRRLRDGKPCRLVATQVVEAGVDLDFSVVFRALGPLDRIVQAAGRCNREGRLPVGRVVVFRPASGGLPPGPYRTATDTTEMLLARGACDLHDPALYQRYFALLYQRTNLDLYDIQSLRRQLRFATVAERFRLIPEDTVPVVVHYTGMPGTERMDQVEEIRSQAIRGGAFGRWFWRRIQPYLVQVRRSLLARYQAEGLVAEFLPGRMPGLWEWRGRYDPVRGLVEGAPDPGDWIW